MKVQRDGKTWWTTAESYFSDNPTRDVAFAVSFTEYERGWGQRPDGNNFFEYSEDAKQYADSYNRKYNVSDKVPDYYIRADYSGPVIRKGL